MEDHLKLPLHSLKSLFLNYFFKGLTQICFTITLLHTSFYPMIGYYLIIWVRFPYVHLTAQIFILNNLFCLFIFLWFFTFFIFFFFFMLKLDEPLLFWKYFLTSLFPTVEIWVLNDYFAVICWSFDPWILIQETQNVEDHQSPDIKL